MDKTVGRVAAARIGRGREGGGLARAELTVCRSRGKLKRQEITRSESPARACASLEERLWKNAKSLSTLICQAIASGSFPLPLPPPPTSRLFLSPRESADESLEL